MRQTGTRRSVQAHAWAGNQGRNGDICTGAPGLLAISFVALAAMYSSASGAQACGDSSKAQLLLPRAVCSPSSGSPPEHLRVALPQIYKVLQAVKPGPAEVGGGVLALGTGEEAVCAGGGRGWWRAECSAPPGNKTRMLIAPRR